MQAPRILHQLLAFAGAALLVAATRLDWITADDRGWQQQADPPPTVTLLAVAALAAVAATLPRRMRAWVPVVVLAFCATTIAFHFPSLEGHLLWDGVTADGQPTGGLVVFTPGPAAWLAVAGGASCLLSALFALAEARRARRTPPAG